MKPEEMPRLFVTALILIAFCGALMFRYSNGLEETLKNITMLAVGFWLGSSKGSTDSAARADKALDIAKEAQAQSGTGGIQSGDAVEITKRDDKG